MNNKKSTPQQDARRMGNALKVAKCYKEALEQESVGQRIKEIVEKVRRRKQENQRRESEPRTVTVLVMPTVQAQMRRCFPGETGMPDPRKELDENKRSFNSETIYPRMECKGVPACNQEENNVLYRLATAGLPGEEDLESIMINNRPKYY